MTTSDPSQPVTPPPTTPQPDPEPAVVLPEQETERGEGHRDAGQTFVDEQREKVESETTVERETERAPE